MRERRNEVNEGGGVEANNPRKTRRRRRSRRNEVNVSKKMTRERGGNEARESKIMKKRMRAITENKDKKMKRK